MPGQIGNVPERKFAAFGLTETGNILAAVTGKKFRVYGLYMDSRTGSISTCRISSGSTEHIGTAAVPMVLNIHQIGAILPLSNTPWFVTEGGQALVATLGADGVAGCIVYDEVDA